MNRTFVRIAEFNCELGDIKSLFSSFVRRKRQAIFNTHLCSVIYAQNPHPNHQISRSDHNFL